MFGAAGKSGRGGRGGTGKRKLPSKFRSASRNLPPSGRPSVDASRNNRTTTATTAVASTAPAEETYDLVTGNPLNFAMIIRLTPDLVDEIKRAESQAGSARIKFHANPNYPSGNVIDVGGKEFRFTWSREMGDLCDIYEECQSGEYGNGQLVESGCAWRKLNVQRVLDESTKNHVKMMSEEAERKSKSRKVTILDHGSSSMKTQIKALAAAEATPWKMPFKQKKEPPYKKGTTEPPSGPPKSANKHVLSSTPSKGRISSSPLPSAREQPLVSASPSRTRSLSRAYASIDDNMSIQASSKEKPSSSEKGMPNRVITNAVPDKQAGKGNLGVKPTDLRSMLIVLLRENPRGMSLKALEKSVGQDFPNSGAQIKLIIKKVATYQPPGRYILKSGAEPESFQKPVSQSGSSPENKKQEASRRSDKCDDIHDPVNKASMKTHTQNDEPANLNSEPGEVLTDAEKHKISLQSPDLHAEKEVLDNSGRMVATSSNSQSGSDSSDSECDSGSHSRSRSKSRSLLGSGSGSSSDSETDTSSKSKEGSDEEVDIMTSDDDNVLKDRLQASEPELSASPVLQRPEGLLLQNATNEKKDIHAAEVIEIRENSHGCAQVAKFDAYFLGSVSSDKEGEQHSQVIKPLSDYHAVPQETQVPRGDLYREKDGFRLEQSDGYQRKSEGKSKKRSAEDLFDDTDVCSKKLKGSATRAPIQSEDGYKNEKRPSKNPRDGAVDKKMAPADSHHRKKAELPGKTVEVGSVLNSSLVYPLKDSNISDVGRSAIIDILNLRRESSVLELGELRDPLPEMTPGIKQSDKIGSINQTVRQLDYWNPDISKERPAGKTGVDSVEPSSANLNAGVIGNYKGLYKSGSQGHDEDLSAVQCNPPQLRRVNQAEVVSQLTNLSDVDSNCKQNKALSSQVVGREGYGDAQRKVPGAMAQLLDDVQGRPLSTIESERRKTDSSANLSDIYNDPPILDSRAGGKENRGTFFNTNDLSYYKYEKDKPELKGPIKDQSQYMEYVKEFQEKYDSYFSISKILESERNEFLKFGRDLEAAKENDMIKYCSILEKLRESYRRCGTRHKRLKKVYVVLHRELETLKEMIRDYANRCPKD
ncbi:hypothetical protein DCAR_0208594 [Daucus carota subsp. sativus]|uniref:Uncharacterized protein n=1 Tax=Daucus carota subsp. sativus TaxID=79200 RepID=A0A166EMT4_DAUCS|nr:PREDICTED: uncharacterized protein LOC108209522 isoform X1 [Daucus carota subsp. sativus]WOG89356.1 hypothetical protein DCAR_0208594 [Daucus carota subsp. sativus]